MKHKNSISQAFVKRNNDVIPRLLRRAKEVAEYPTTTKRLFEIVAELPTEQYFITDDAAISYIRKRFLHGVHTKYMNPYKQRLFDALYSEVERMMKDEKYKAMGLKNTVICALTHKAPCLGLTPFAAFRLYLRHQKKQKHGIV